MSYLVSVLGAVLPALVGIRLSRYMVRRMLRDGWLDVGPVACCGCSECCDCFDCMEGRSARWDDLPLA